MSASGSLGETGQTPELPLAKIRIAINDPSRFTRRVQITDGDYESMAGWVTRAIAEILGEWLAGRTVVQRPSNEEWVVFWGGRSPDGARAETHDSEEDATEHLQWMDAGAGVGVASRDVFYGPWKVARYQPPVTEESAAESSGDGEKCDGSHECPAGDHDHGCFSDDPCAHESDVDSVWTTHVVMDSSDDPECIEDCPGCRRVIAEGGAPSAE